MSEFENFLAKAAENAKNLSHMLSQMAKTYEEHHKDLQNLAKSASQKPVQKENLTSAVSKVYNLLGQTSETKNAVASRQPDFTGKKLMSQKPNAKAEVDKKANVSNQKQSKIPKTDSSSESDSESSSSATSEEEPLVKTPIVAQNKSQPINGKAENSSSSSDESSDDSDSSSDEEQNVAEVKTSVQTVNSVSKPQKAATSVKPPVKKDDSSSSDSSSSDSSSEDEAEPQKENSLKVDVTKTQNGAKNDSSSSDDDSDSSSSSDSSEEKPKIIEKTTTKPDAIAKKDDHSTVKQNAGKLSSSTPRNVQKAKHAHNNGNNRPQLSNSFDTKKNDSYGQRANKNLSNLKGKSFRKEMTKMKKGSYSGGKISNKSNSFKFED